MLDRRNPGSRDCDKFVLYVQQSVNVAICARRVGTKSTLIIEIEKGWLDK